MNVKPGEVNCCVYGVGAVSALGAGVANSYAALKSGKSCFSVREFDGAPAPVAGLPPAAETKVAELLEEHPRYREVDRTVQLALPAAREAVAYAGWQGEKELGVVIGSSRGATGLLERAHAEYLATRKVPVVTSPITTLGNISSWVAQDLLSSGPAVSHSVTCSTALHSVAVALAWIRAGMGRRFLVGGAESCLTPFTIAQMRALRIYTPFTDDPFPCRPCAEWKETRPVNTFVLGEGACLLAVGAADEQAPALARIESFGCAIEPIESSTSITEEGHGLRTAMERALRGLGSGAQVDLIVLHAPGTVKGDQAELCAVRALFGESPPMLSSPKWVFGHTFGAAGALGVLYALFCLETGFCADFPYKSRVRNVGRPIRRVMVNAAGFGGNAACLILRRM